MRGLSRASLAEVEEHFNAVAGSADLGTLADELFSVADLFDQEHGLRRNLSDPARPAAQKAQVARVLLEGKVSNAALETVVAAVSAKWVRSGDLTDALERLGVIAAAAEAEGQGKLDEVEDELFRFGRIAASNLELHRTLTEPASPPSARGSFSPLCSMARSPRPPSAWSRNSWFIPEDVVWTGLEEFGSWSPPSGSASSRWCAAPSSSPSSRSSVSPRGCAPRTAATFI